jgi:hypothetical protein
MIGVVMKRYPMLGIAHIATAANAPKRKAMIVITGSSAAL